MYNIDDDNLDNDNQQNDYVVQPTLKSLVSSTKFLNRKVHKYKNEKAKVKQLMHDVYDDDGSINTGTITLHQGSIAEYEITDETDPKTLSTVQYVKDHFNLNVNDTLYLKNQDVSLDTLGQIVIHNNTNGLVSSGNIIIKDSNDNDIINMSNTGDISANNLNISNEINADTINITNELKADSININKGTVIGDPVNGTDIVNKQYVDSHGSNDALSKSELNEQTVAGPVLFNQRVKTTILSLPIIY